MITPPPASSGDWQADMLTRALLERTGGRLAVPSREGMAICGQADTALAARRRRERGTLPFDEIELGRDGRKFVTIPELVRVLLQRPRIEAEAAKPASRSKRGRPRMTARAGEASHG
jgi:hypothetical protein